MKGLVQMKPITCDVFSNRKLALSCQTNLHGNIYVKGNLDVIYTCNPIEIFGDVVVDGLLHGCDIIIHGNLESNSLRCDNISVDGDIKISKYAQVSVTMTSYSGNISILGPADISNLIACEGSIHVEKQLNSYSIKAFDSIYVNGDIVDAAEIIAGSGIESTGNISFERLSRYSDEFVGIQVLSGGIHSKNMHIN